MPLILFLEAAPPKHDPSMLTNLKYAHFQTPVFTQPCLEYVVGVMAEIKIWREGEQLVRLPNPLAFKSGGDPVKEQHALFSTHNTSIAML